MPTEPEDVVLKEIDKVMDEFIDKIFQYSQENLVDDGKIDTGHLLRTANINRSFLEKEIVYPALYADIIEYGRNPGTMPPSSALESWVRRKLGINDEAKVKRLAFAIAKAIKNRGISPSMFMRRAVDKARSEFNL